MAPGVSWTPGATCLSRKAHNMDELEVIEKAQEVIGNVVFGLQVIGAGLALLSFGYKAGIQRGWQDAAQAGEHECKTEAQDPYPLS
jgi:hypothetical protein